MADIQLWSRKAKLKKEPKEGKGYRKREKQSLEGKETYRWAARAIAVREV